MKFSIPAPTLKAALARCARVADRSRGIPILAHVKIEAWEGLSLRASNLQTFMTIGIDQADIAAEGATCAPLDEMLKFASAAGKAVITAETKDHVLRLTWGRSSAELHTMEAGDFPTIVLDGGETLRPVDGDLLAAAVRFCTPAVDPAHAQHYLQGVSILDAPEGARIYGTNGYTAHRAVTAGTRFGGSGIIAASDCALIADMAGPVRFCISERRWGVEIGSVEIWGSVIDGVYPDMDRVMRTIPVTAIADREALVDAVNLAAIGTGAQDKISAVAINAADDAIRLAGIGYGSSLASGARAEIDAATKAPGAAAIASKYLTAALGAIESDLVSVAIGDGIIGVEPAEQRADLTLSTIIMGWRATAEQLAA